LVTDRQQLGWTTVTLVVLLVMGGAGLESHSTALGGGGGGRRGGFMLPGMSGGPDITAIKGQLGATDEEWTVIGPILQRLLVAVQMLDAADSGELANSNTDRGGRFGGMANDTFGGPAEIAEGVRIGVNNVFGGNRAARSTTIASPPPPASTAAATKPAVAQLPASQPTASQPMAAQPVVAATAPLPDAGSASDTVTLDQAIADLQDALSKPTPNIPELMARLRAVRDARTKTKLAAELAARELAPLLTTDQQAVLMALGYLR
jgi:hypothetical protein